MSSRDSRRSSRALVLAAVLAFASFPALAMPRNGASHLSDGGAFSAFFEALRSVWLNVWGESGLTIDPDGRPEGSGMTNVVGNEGMSIDPSGGGAGNGNATTPGDGTDGTSIDPHG
jgi:hypothetical protein